MVPLAGATLEDAKADYARLLTERETRVEALRAQAVALEHRALRNADLALQAL